MSLQTSPVCSSPHVLAGERVERGEYLFGAKETEAQGIGSDAKANSGRTGATA